MVVYLPPPGAKEIDLSKLNSKKLEAIEAVLAARGENRDIVKIWWDPSVTTYYILVDFESDQKPTVTTVTMEMLFAIRDK